jgi:hypothetical protein
VVVDEKYFEVSYLFLMHELQKQALLWVWQIPHSIPIPSSLHYGGQADDVTLYAIVMSLGAVDAF